MFLCAGFEQWTKIRNIKFILMHYFLGGKFFEVIRLAFVKTSLDFNLFHMVGKAFIRI